MNVIGKLLQPSRRHAAIAATLLTLAIILGGGGTPNPISELWLEGLAGVAALVWLWQKGPLRLPTDRRLWLIAVLVVGLTAVQLVPLPPAIWHALPQRETEIAALQLVGAADSWQPFSTSPPRTLASLLSLVAPVIILLMTGALRSSERRWLIGVAALMALVSAILGAVQLSAGPEGFKFYDASPSQLVIGFQANRNSTADVLLIGLVALAAFWAGRSPRAEKQASGQLRKGWWFGAAEGLIALACILTMSRTGVLLLPAALLAAAAIVTGAGTGKAIGTRPTRWVRSFSLVSVGGFIMAAAASILLRNNAVLDRVAGRFEQGSGRDEIWRDSLYTMGQYWPYGSGTGTFVPSFIAFEPLEAVDFTVPNRAHNDYLELALETGACGIAVLAVIAGLVVWMAVQSWRERSSERSQIAFGVAALAIIAVHSTVDYPLRSMSLACLAAVAAGVFARPPGEPDQAGA